MTLVWRYAPRMVVEVGIEGEERPPPGTPLRVQVLDTTYADAPARVVEETTSEVAAGAGDVLQRVELPFEPSGSAAYTVRAHVDVSGNGRVTPGDFVTTASHPVDGADRVRVAVRKV